MARIVQTFPDIHGNVRTVKIAVRDRRGTARESQTACNTCKDTMKVGIQRLVTLLPVEEQDPSPGTVATGATERTSDNPQEGN